MPNEQLGGNGCALIGIICFSILKLKPTCTPTREVSYQKLPKIRGFLIIDAPLKSVYKSNLYHFN